MKESKFHRSVLPDGISKFSSNIGVIILGLLVGGAGIIAVVVMLLLPLLRAFNARHWVEVPCTILASQVGVSHNSENDNYRVEVRFAYYYLRSKENSTETLESDPASQRYESTLYDFTNGAYRSEYSKYQKSVEQLTVGSQQTCAVNPQHPSEAVLRRELPAHIWFGLIPLIFPLAVLGMVYASFRWRLHPARSLPKSAKT